MIYQEPLLQEIDAEVLDRIWKQRQRLKMFTQNSPRRWFGSLRQSTFARAIQGSNSIEGYNATIDEAVAAIEEEPPLDPRTETWMAINGYREALTYIMQAAQDPYFQFNAQFLKSVHFMMINYDLSKHPGHWRPGATHVVSSRSKQIVYEAPDEELVDSLVRELVEYLDSSTKSSSMVRAAMAHLNLTMIHPFSDGNGRMARALQTFVLARDGYLHPVFSSIEEWLGRNTEEYYAVLAETGQGVWSPQREALPWVRFCLKAHYQQASTLIRRNEEYGNLFDLIDDLVRQNGLDERVAVPLFNAALGLRLTRSRYKKSADVTQYIASRDLKALSDLQILDARGEKRGRFYRAGTGLAEMRARVRIKRPLEDPYELARNASSPRLPGM